MNTYATATVTALRTAYHACAPITRDRTTDADRAAAVKVITAALADALTAAAAWRSAPLRTGRAVNAARIVTAACVRVSAALAAADHPAPRTRALRYHAATADALVTLADALRAADAAA